MDQDQPVPRRPRLTRKRKIVLSSLVLIATTAAGFGLLEIYIRLTRPPLDLLALTGQRAGPHPVATWAVADAFCAFRPQAGEWEPGKTVNSLGFISTPELTVAKPAGTIRIVFLGGSSTAGVGHTLRDDQTWPWQAHAELQQQFPEQRIEFINAAAGAYTSFESYGRLWSRLRFFQPDVIVVYHGWNEMYYFDQVDSIEQWKTLRGGGWTLDRTGQPVGVYEPLPIDAIARLSQLLTRARLHLTHPKSGGEVGTPDQALESDFDPRALEIWRTNLRLLRETAAICNAQLIVGKQATLITAETSPADQARCGYHFHGFDHAAHVRAFSRIYEVIDEEIPPESIVDFTHLSGQPEHFHDHIHPTPAGADAIAKAVTKKLATLIATAGTD